MTVDVTVVGGGISGLACARAVRDAGGSVRVIDRGRRPGGRLSSRIIDGRAVDLGASYFVVGDDARFARLAADWEARGVAREWTDTFSAIDADGAVTRKTGPVRWAAPGGSRALVLDLADGVDVESGREVAEAAPFRVNGRDAGEVVLAMPEPQARRLANGIPVAPQEWEPVIAVVMRWDERRWPADLHGAFVNGDPDVAFVAEPDTVVPPVVTATRRLLGIDVEPVSALAHRWTFARPARATGEPYFRSPGLSLCGDAWGESAAVRTAWASGDALGRTLAAS